jgi:hypothetical protein
MFMFHLMFRIMIYDDGSVLVHSPCSCIVHFMREVSRGKNVVLLSQYYRELFTLNEIIQFSNNKMWSWVQNCKCF